MNLCSTVIEISISTKAHRDIIIRAHLFQILELKLLLTAITEAKGSDASQSEVQKVHLKIF